MMVKELRHKCENEWEQIILFLGFNYPQISKKSIDLGLHTIYFP